MRITQYWPGKTARNREKFFDSMAQPFFHAGNDVGCAVLHGFTGTPANMRVVSEALAAAGYTVYAPLLSGHGTSLAQMDSCTAADWERDAFQAYARLEEAGCKRFYMLGLSMGGLLSAIVAAQRPCAGLVLLCTPLRLRSYLHTAGRAAPLLPFITTEDPAPKYPRESLHQGYKGAPLRRLEDLELLSLRARSNLYRIQCPALVLQSVSDKRVDLRSVAIAQYGIGSGDVQAVWLQHSQHVCTVGPEREDVAAYCRTFIEQQEKRRDHDG